MDSTYEGLKHEERLGIGKVRAGLDSTYEGLKLRDRAQRAVVVRVWTVPMRA